MSCVKYREHLFYYCSIHVTLAMLASSATENSGTQKQLLDALGRTKTLHSLENYYQTTLTDYEVVIKVIFYIGVNIPSPRLKKSIKMIEGALLSK